MRGRINIINPNNTTPLSMMLKVPGSGAALGDYLTPLPAVKPWRR